MILNEVIQLFEFVKILLRHRDHPEVRQVALHDQVALRRLLLVNTLNIVGGTLDYVVVACCVVAYRWMGC